jgi:hypothetical protein
MKSPFKEKLTSSSLPFTDVVGLELGASCPDGVPAVRLRKLEGQTELVAAGFLRLPGTLPPDPSAALEEPLIWSLPRAFQAPHAALAVTSLQVYLRHASGPGEEAADDKQIPYRTVSRVLAADLPPLTAGLPEFQAAWAAHLLPEGRQPTACSLQVSSAAAINSFIASPLFKTLAGTAIVLFVFPGHTSLAAFHEAKLVLYREHPIGYSHVRTAISNQMRIEPSLADSVLQDTFIDPIPMIEPVLKSLFRQVEISSDYLLRRRNCKTQQFFVCGLPTGANYWSSIFSHMMNIPLTLFRPFDGLQNPLRPAETPADFAAAEPFLTTALGAAQAVLEDDVMTALGAARAALKENV